MTAKVFAVTEDGEEHPIGGLWFTIGDAAGDINGGDFWRDVRAQLPGRHILEVRIRPSEMIAV